MTEHYDALVVGAGPAGLAASMELSRAGWKTLLIDKSNFPRDKVCGGFIGPENKQMLDNYGVLEAVLARGAQKVSHIHLSAPNGQSVRVPLRYQGRDDFGLGFSRRGLDELLLQQALKNGVVFEDAAVIIQTASGSTDCDVQLRLMKSQEIKNVRARHLIYAYGPGHQQKSTGNRIFGVSGLFDHCRDLNSDVIMHFIESGHAGINAFEDRRVNVCYVIQERLFKQCQGKYEVIWQNFLDSNPLLRRQMMSSKLISPWKGTFVDINRPSRFFDGQAFYAGDAAGLIHPVAGGGISMALSGGMLLGRLMGQYAPKDLPKESVAVVYERIWKKHFQNSTSVSKWIGSLSHRAPVANFLVRVLKAREKTVHNLFDLFHKQGLNDFYKEGACLS